MISWPWFWKSLRFDLAEDLSKLVIFKRDKELPGAFGSVCVLGCEFCGSGDALEERGRLWVHMGYVVLRGNVEHVKRSFLGAFIVSITWGRLKWLVHLAVLVWSPLVCVSGGGNYLASERSFSPIDVRVRGCQEWHA